MNYIIKFWYIILLGTFLLAAFFLQVLPHNDNIITVLLDGRRLDISVARTPREQYRGLGGRDSIGDMDGMLFLFGKSAKIGIVMRDMRFPIDIVWLQGGRVVDIAPDVQTEIGVSNDMLTVYYPRMVADMVLEFPAGYTRNHDLKIGAQLALLE